MKANNFFITILLVLNLLLTAWYIGIYSYVVSTIAEKEISDAEFINIYINHHEEIK